MGYYRFDTQQRQTSKELASAMLHCSNLTCLDVCKSYANDLDLKLQMLKIDQRIKTLEKEIQEYKEKHPNIHFYYRNTNQW